jgi:hypothetical protein
LTAGHVKGLDRTGNYPAFRQVLRVKRENAQTGPCSEKVRFKDEF